MLVQRVAMPAAVESWTVLGDDDIPIEPVERYLAYLTDVGSPNTVRSYAFDLKDFFTFLRYRGLDWKQVRMEDLGEFVAWLRLPAAGRSGQVAALPLAEPQVGPSTINRELSALADVLIPKTQRLAHANAAGVKHGDQEAVPQVVQDRLRLRGRQHPRKPSWAP